MRFFTGRNCGQGNIFTPICHSVHRGVSGEPPRDQGEPPGPGRPPQDQGEPPWTKENHPTQDQGEPPHQTRENPPGPRRHPPDQGEPPPGPCRPPPGRRLQHTVNERPVRILLECILVVLRVCLCHLCDFVID